MHYGGRELPRPDNAAHAVEEVEEVAATSVAFHQKTSSAKLRTAVAFVGCEDVAKTRRNQGRDREGGIKLNVL